LECHFFKLFITDVFDDIYIIFYSIYKTCVAEIAPQILRILAIIVTITVEFAR
jgi:hypothetical protein